MKTTSENFIEILKEAGIGYYDVIWEKKELSIKLPGYKAYNVKFMDQVLRGKLLLHNEKLSKFRALCILYEVEYKEDNKIITVYLPSVKTLQSTSVTTTGSDDPYLNLGR